jgi:hypothetical protein
MKLWYRITYEKKGFWFFNSIKGFDFVKAESIIDVLTQTKIPSDWRVNLITPVDLGTQQELDKMQELQRLQKQEVKTNE